jgi:hypothetical protein
MAGTVRRPSRSIVGKLLPNSLEDSRIKSIKLLAHTIHVRMRMRTLKTHQANSVTSALVAAATI